MISILPYGDDVAIVVGSRRQNRSGCVTLTAEHIVQKYLSECYAIFIFKRYPILETLQTRMSEGP